MKIYTWLFAIGLASIYNSCSTKEVKSDSFAFPEIIDTIPKLQYYLSPGVMNSPINYVFAINQIGDSINLNSIDEKLCGDFESYLRDEPKILNTDSLEIYIDASIETCHERYIGRIPTILCDENFNQTFLSIPAFKENENVNVQLNSTLTKWKNFIDVYIKTIPVYVVNTSKKSKLIRCGCNRLHMIQEAMDNNGDWKPIEYIYGEDWGGFFFELKSGYYAMAMVYKYSGPFNTKLRLKFRNGENIYYSNEYSGSINLDQFNYPAFFKNINFSKADSARLFLAN